MAIEILVKPEIDNASLDKSAAEMEAVFKAASARSGKQIQDNLSDALTKASVTAVNAAGQVSTAEAKLTDVRQKAETQAKNVAKAEETLTRLRQTPMLTEAIAAAESRLADERGKHTGILARLTAAEEAAAKARRTESLADRAVSSAFKDATETGSGLADAFGNLTSLATGVGPAIAGVGAALIPLAGIATAASGALGLLPGALLGAGAAFGTFKLATSGVGDALGDMGDPKKFAEDLQGLAPAAQQFALTVQAIMPQLEGLKSASQNSFFAGMGPQIQALAQVYLPSLKTALTGISSAFNEAFGGAAKELMSPATSSALRSTLSNITAGAHDLAGALGPVVHAFASIAEVSSGFMPQLAQAATNAANAFQGFIENASRTGELKHWIQDGIDTMHVLASATVTVGQGIAELEPIGMKALPAITSAANDFKSAMDGIKTATDGVTSAITTVQNAFTSLGNVVDPILNGIQDGLWAITNPANAIAQIFGQGVDPQSITNPRKYSGGGGKFDGSEADKWLQADQAAHPNRATGGAGTFRRRDGGVGTIPNSAPTTNYAVPPPPDPKAKDKADKAPAGSKDDPLFTMATGSPSSSSSGSSANDPNATYNPLAEAASGGFSLPNIARLGTTFLAELALGNPLGKLQAQQKQRGDSANNALYVQDVTQDGQVYTGDQWKSLQAQQRVDKSQASYDKASAKYGADSPEAQRAQLALTKAQQAQQNLATSQAIPSGNASQSAIAQQIIATGRQLGAPDSVIKSALEAGAVESGLQNLHHGDRDSQGIFQMRPSQGWGSVSQVTDPNYAINKYYDTALGKPGAASMDPGALAQSVEGSAYPARYGQHAAQAQSYLNAYGGGGGQSAGIPTPSLGHMATGSGVGGVGASAAAGINSAGGQAKAPAAGTGKGAGVSGGILGTAESAAATALNGIAPGAGAAAQIATEEANRFAGYLGQLGGIAASGILETFSLHGSDMTSSGGLPGKIVGGLAGAHPVTPNSAASTQPAQKAKGDQSNAKNNGGDDKGGVTINNNGGQHYHNTDSGQVASEQNRQLMQATAANPI